MIGRWSALVAVGIAGSGLLYAGCSDTESNEGVRSVRQLQENDTRVRPVLECVADDESGQLEAVFGYLNPTESSIRVPLGPSNKIQPPSAVLPSDGGTADDDATDDDDDRIPPTGFLPGRNFNTFSVRFDPGETIVWTLQGRTSSASGSSQRCPTIPDETEGGSGPLLELIPKTAAGEALRGYFEAMLTPPGQDPQMAAALEALRDQPTEPLSDILSDLWAADVDDTDKFLILQAALQANAPGMLPVYLQVLDIDTAGIDPELSHMVPGVDDLALLVGLAIGGIFELADKGDPMAQAEGQALLEHPFAPFRREALESAVAYARDNPELFAELRSRAKPDELYLFEEPVILQAPTGDDLVLPEGVDVPDVLAETVPHPRPVLECVREGGQGLVAVFGYKNDLPVPLEVPVGANNRFHPAPEQRGQPEEFHPGRMRAVFEVPFSASQLVWKLGGRTATASASSRRCDGQ